MLPGCSEQRCKRQPWYLYLQCWVASYSPYAYFHLLEWIACYVQPIQATLDLTCV